MASLSLKISVKHANVVKTMQFEPSTIVYDACRMIRERIPEAQMGNATEFGMFLADEDPKKGVWLEAGRTLDYYLLRSGDLLEYKKKHRPLKVRMLDGTVKTVMVDDSHTVAQLLVTICTRIGITNHDEYSLVREGEKIREAAEPPTPVKKNYYGTMTRTMTRLSLDRTLQRDEKKMEALKKKLHTDDELNWLDHGRTLREQGIDDTETLLLRRKFFYSDQNVDSRDPVQLNLLYVQARDGILNGTHPVTVDEAMMFAAYQTQIQFGDHIETKHKSGFLDLKEFLPKEYVKNKGIEKKIWLEHRKLAGLSELDAKVRYTQQCRSLKTYGVTFFLVKEKMKGKNKLVPRLLGITKDSVMRVDEKTKEILKVWPLTTVRRWAASPKSFTLDFGDYSESYYSVQTTEGETISQLIAGYIDIILRKKKGKDRFGMDGEEESTMLEDSVSPARATIMQHQENKVGHVNEGSVAIPAVMRAHDGAESYSMGSMPRAEYATIRGQIHSAHMPPINTQAQQALMGNISSGFNSISAAQAELGSRAELPPLGSDPASLKWKQNTLDVSKQNVTSQLAAMSAATASVVTLTSDLKHQKIVDRFRGTPNNVKGEPEQTDFTAVGSAVTTISSNLTEMSKGIKMVAALLEDYGQGERLLDAARNLAGAFSDLLSAAKPGSTEREPEPRQNLLTAAGNIGEHGREVLHEMGEVDTDPRFQDALMALAKAVANATATLVLKAKNVASKAEDPAMQNKVIASATQTALSTSQLVACTKVVAPTISHPACQEQLIDAAKLVAKSVEKTVDSSQMATHDEFLLKDLGAAATQVTQALNDLLQHIKQASKAKGGEQYEDHCDTIISASDRLFASMGNASDMIKQAKILAEATSHLVNSIKTSADTTDDTDSQKRLLGAAKVLADATARMVEAAKGCAVNPHDSDEQENLRKAAEDLRAATNAAAGNAIKKKLVGKLETSEETVTVKTMTFTKVKLTHYDKDLLKKILEELQNAAKHAAAVATQTIAASQAASSSNKNPSSQQQLVSSCKHVADHIPRLVQGVRGSRAQPDSPSAQLLLINASQEFISPANNMNSAAKAAVPTVSDQAASMQLSNCSKQLAQALAELRSAAQKAQDACGPLEIDSALDTICQLDSDLVEIKKSAAQGQLVPLPDESGEQCAQELGHTSKTVGASMAQLLTAAAQGNENYTGLAARDTANALRTLTGAVRGVAAATSDRQAQDHLIDTARDVMDKSVNLIEEAKKAVNDPNNPDNQQRLAQVAKAVSHALNNCVNCLPGQRDVDFAIRNIGEASKALLSGQVQNVDLTQYPGYYGATGGAYDLRPYDLRPYGSPQGAEGYTIPQTSEGQQSEGHAMYQNGVPGMYGGQYGVQNGVPGMYGGQYGVQNGVPGMYAGQYGVPNEGPGMYGIPAMYEGQQVILLNGAPGFTPEGDRVVNYGVQSGVHGQSFVNVEELKPQEVEMTSSFTSMTSGSGYDTMSIKSADLDWNEVDFDQTVYNYGVEQGKPGQALLDLSALRQDRKRKPEIPKEVRYVEEERHILNYGIDKNVSGKAIINLDCLRPPTKKVKRKKTKVETKEEGEVIEWDDSDVETVATVESLTDNRQEDSEADERYDEEKRRIRMQMEQPIVKRRTYHIDETDEDIHVDDSTPVFEAFFRFIGHGEPYPEKPEKVKEVIEFPHSDFTMPERLDFKAGLSEIEERKIKPQERNLDFEAFFRHYMEEARKRMETPMIEREWVKVPGDEDLPKDTVKPNFDAFFRNYPHLEPAEQVEEEKKDREEILTYETEEDLTIRSTEEIVRGKVEEKPAERNYIWPNFDEFFKSYPSMVKGREFGIQCNVKDEVDGPRMRKIGVLQRYRRLVRVAAMRYNLALSSKIKVARICKEFHLSATRLVVSVLSVFSKMSFGASSLRMEAFTIFNQDLQKGDVSFQEVQTMLSTAAQELNMASSELVVASKGTHEQLAQASGKFSKDFSLLLEAGMQMAAQTSDDEQQSLMVSNLKSISMSSSKLLLAAKSLSADPNAPNAKNQLASAARSVTDSINQLINICMQTAPGQKECDNALRNIETVTQITEVHSSSSVETTETRKVSELKKDMEMHIILPHPDIITKSVEVYISHFNSQTRVMRSMLDNPMEPVNDLTYFDCLETVMDKSKTLGESMSSITQHAKNSEHEEFGSAVTRASTAVCGLTEAASQTAYLVGIADPSSQAGRQGLVDQSQFARANQAIQMACQQLLDPTTSQAQVRAGKTSTVTVLSAATVIAKHTSSLCNMCRVASTKTSNPVAKRHFVQSAKEVANSTANLVKSIKALDGNFTEQNRQQVAEASRPLMEAVENLTTFASNPEFASVPAQISIEARKAQEPIVIAGRTIIDSTSSLITTAKLLAVNPKDPPTWQLLAGHSKTVSDSIKRLIASIRDKAPGQRECDRGIQVINQCIRDVDQASLSAVTQKLEARNEGTTQIFQEQMNNAAHEIGKNVDGVASAAKEKAEKLGHQVTQLSSYFDPLASAAINLASKTMNSQKQANLLEQTKTVAESALQLVYTSKEGGGNPKATHAHAAIDEAAEGMKEAVDDLLKTLDESASETGAVFGMVDGITKAMSDMVDGRLEDKPDGTFVDYQTKMVKIAKQIARTSHDMVGKASSSPEELGPQANALSHDFSELAAQSKGAMATINSPELSDRIRNSVQDLGNSCVDVVNNAGAIQSNPTDTYAKKDLIENSRAVSEKVLFVLASLQAGSRGTQACINAASTVSGIIGDLDTTIMFASAGTLSPEMEDEAFADHRENILKTAKALVEDTKTLVSGAASSQEHLAAAAQSAVDTITKLADAVKSGAASLGPQDAEAQVLLINAVKDVAVALGELIEATKNASGKPVQDPSMVQLKNSAKVMVTNVTSLLKTVKTVEDEAARGTRALEATIEAIKQEMRILSSMDPPEKRLPPEDLIRSTKPVTLLTAKAVAAGTSCRQDDVIAVANMSRKSVGDLIVTCKASAFGAEQRETTERAMEVGRNTVSMYVELLMHVLSILQKPTHEGKQKLAHFSKRVATAVAELVQTAEAIKGSEWVDPEDPTVVAENELLGAASAIEAAAKKLSELKPRPKAKEVDETLNFEEQILEAAKSIAAATSALVKAASTAQRELVAQGKVGASRAMAYDDGQWSQGLISAARMVAAATGSLCEAANEMVQGLASEEKLISSAKQVAASTAQLLVACKVKADPDSEAMRRLQQAGNRVKHASEELVKAAQQAAAIEEEERNIELSKRRVPTIAMEIQAQEEILRKEKELEEARKMLFAIRTAKYKNRPHHQDDSD
ncbi:talin-1-like isoform X3 [Branchiostoma lanceolatum]|uniref:talin-1-like isoform X3 n=1 Tax=Branchiostoma lanceolatum TaxID=7740 RepID=UPI003453710A